MAEHPGQFACDSAVDIFHDGKIGGEEYIKVALVHLLWG